jgi:hypothetical protein
MNSRTRTAIGGGSYKPSKKVWYMSHNRVFVRTYPNAEGAETDQDMVKKLHIIPEQDRNSNEGGK